jgi:hypothetical protein
VSRRNGRFQKIGVGKMGVGADAVTPYGTISVTKMEGQETVNETLAQRVSIDANAKPPPL